MADISQQLARGVDLTTPLLQHKQNQRLDQQQQMVQQQAINQQKQKQTQAQATALSKQQDFQLKIGDVNGAVETQGNINKMLGLPFDKNKMLTKLKEDSKRFISFKSEFAKIKKGGDPQEIEAGSSIGNQLLQEFTFPDVPAGGISTSPGVTDLAQQIRAEAPQQPGVVGEQVPPGQPLDTSQQDISQLRDIKQGLASLPDTPEKKAFEERLDGQITDLIRQKPPGDRKTAKDATGRLRFTDDGSLVFPAITQEQITQAEAKKHPFEATKRTEEISLTKFQKPFRLLNQKEKSSVLSARERSITQGLTTSLRKEFNALEEVKQFKSLKPQFLKMEALGNKFKKNPNINKAFLDQGLIVIFNKMLDPASVVRESEFARTPEFIPLLNRIEGFLPKLKQGGAGMTNADRIQLIDDAKTLFDVHADEFNLAIERRTELAKEAGVKPALAVPAKRFERGIADGTIIQNAAGEKQIRRNGEWQAL